MGPRLCGTRVLGLGFRVLGIRVQGSRGCGNVVLGFWFRFRVRAVQSLAQLGFSFVWLLR